MKFAPKTTSFAFARDGITQDRHRGAVALVVFQEGHEADERSADP